MGVIVLHNKKEKEPSKRTEIHKSICSLANKGLTYQKKVKYGFKEKKLTKYVLAYRLREYNYFEDENYIIFKGKIIK